MSFSLFALQFALTLLCLVSGAHHRTPNQMRTKHLLSFIEKPTLTIAKWIDPWVALSLISLWGISIASHVFDVAETIALTLWTVAMVCLALSGSNVWLKSMPDTNEAPVEVQRRLIQLQHQLQKLHEKEALVLQLEKTNQSQQILNRYGEHFKRVLITIENHLIYGEHEHAEQVITIFSRHLRQLLHEGSTPFIALKDSIEHIKTHLEMMALLTGSRFLCDVDDDMLDEETRNRCTERFQLSPWVEECMWPYFSLAERSLKELNPVTLMIDAGEDEVNLSFCGQFSDQDNELLGRDFRLLGSSNFSAVGSRQSKATEWG
tara:strand:+ start:651 stop:1607 length:957 start_codon:yes stop_codon:yes gene_type:complete